MSRPATPAGLFGIAALGLLSGSGWLFSSCWPRTMPLALAAAIHFALIAALGALWMSRLHKPWPSPPSPARSLQLALASLCLFALPVLLIDRSSGSVPELSIVAIFAGVPVMTALWSALLGDTLAITATLPPGLLGWCGALLLFPLAIPHSPRQAGFVALVVFAAICFSGAGLWLHRLMQGVPVAAVLGIAGLANAAAFALAAAFSGEITGEALHQAAPELLRGIVYDLPVVALTLWLLREMPALRVASRTLLGPAVTVIEGYLLLHERPPVLTLVAVAMLLLGALWLLFSNQNSPPYGLFLTHPMPSPNQADN